MRRNTMVAPAPHGAPHIIPLGTRSGVMVATTGEKPDLRQRKPTHRRRDFPGGDRHGPPRRRGPVGYKGPGRHHKPPPPPNRHRGNKTHPPIKGRHPGGVSKSHHHHRNHHYGALMRYLTNQGGGFGGGGVPGPTIIPPQAGSSGGGISPVIVIGGLSIAAVIALVIYEWYRHKHAKEEARDRG